MSVNNLFCCAGCGKKEPKQKGFQAWVYKKRDGSELCCCCQNNQKLIDSNCFNCGKDLNINSEYLGQHTFPRKSGNEWGDIWESSYCVNCVPDLDEKISGCTNRERIEVRGDIRERDSDYSKNHNQEQRDNCCALKSCRKAIFHKNGKGVLCTYCDQRFCSHECIRIAPKCEQQLVQEHHHHDDDKWNFAICNKCDKEYSSANCWYYFSFDEIENKSINGCCLNCWKSEEKHYRHQSSPQKVVYKLDSRQRPKLTDGHYYFKDGKWIDKFNGKTDPDLEQKGIWRKLSTEEVLKDPWFNKEIDKFFGLNPQQPENNSNVLVQKPTSTEQKAFGNLINNFAGSAVKQISLNSEGNLLVEYVLPPKSKNFSEQTVWVSKNSEEVADNSELSTVKNYLQANNKSSINQQELNSLLNSSNSSVSPDSPNNNNLGRNLAIGASVLLVSGLLIGWLVKSRKIRKH